MSWIEHLLIKPLAARMGQHQWTFWSVGMRDELYLDGNDNQQPAMVVSLIGDPLKRLQA